jgi:hypothetical protein
MYRSMLLPVLATSCQMFRITEMSSTDVLESSGTIKLTLVAVARASGILLHRLGLTAVINAGIPIYWSTSNYSLTEN